MSVDTGNSETARKHSASNISQQRSCRAAYAAGVTEKWSFGRSAGSESQHSSATVCSAARKTSASDCPQAADQAVCTTRTTA